MQAKTVAAVGLRPEESTRRARVSGLDRALQILDHLQARGEADSIYAIAKEAGAPLSTIYVIVDELVSRRMLVRRPDGTVWLGERLLHYGLTCIRALDLMLVAREEMNALCRIAAETVQVCGRDGDVMVVLDMADGPGHFQVASRVGTRVPLNWTASGRLLVAHLPDDERIALFRRCATQSPTGTAEIDPAALSRSSRAAFDDRLSIQAGESEFSVACIASPVCDSEGACRVTLSIVVPEYKARERRAQYAQLVQAASIRVEQKMGWRGVA